jgi:formamidopyrimidine-DNA glycosylase
LRSRKHKSENPRNFSGILKGKTLIDVERKGKHLLLHLSENRILWCHLGMTGRFVEADNIYKLDKHDHAHFEFAKGKSETSLTFRDVRKFGHLRLVQTDEISTLPEIASLGPEPLTISSRDFVALFAARKRVIKPALLDQHILAGIGNIYADETLHVAGIHPQTRCLDIDKATLQALHKIIQKTLKKAISSMGTTVDNYSGVNGEPGKFQNYVKVYGREGQPCHKCGAPIVREVISGRSAHYCEVCQQ